MNTLFERYEDGEFADVWSELRRGLHSKEETETIVRATMYRVRENVDRIVQRLHAAGYRFAYPESCRVAPTEEDRAAVDELPLLLGGTIPQGLAACLSIIGEVNLCGTHPDWDPPAYLFEGDDRYPMMTDPLVLPSGTWVRDEAREWINLPTEEAEQFRRLIFAPDHLHKAGISGSTHDMRLPDSNIDPVLLGVDGRPGITLVEYLRVSLRWGGFPGFEFESRATPSLVRDIARELSPF